MIEGLYSEEFEKDSCGVGCVVSIENKATHDIVSDALVLLENMEHRGATGADIETGDGSGILLQIPDEFLREELLAMQGIVLPDYGQYGLGMLFFPKNKELREICRKWVNTLAKKMGFQVIAYRIVPVDAKIPGYESKSVEPFIEQLFVKHINPDIKDLALERKLFVLRHFITHSINRSVESINKAFYFASLSSRTVVYKGQLTTFQLGAYFYDLKDPRVVSSLALVHSRFSTNTFPNWKLAQPFRYLAHNGEINTIRGNLIKMESKEALMSSPYFTRKEMEWLIPVTDSSNSDSSNLDALIELLTLTGRSLPHAMMMLVPEAWQNDSTMPEEKRAFYQYHASMMEPWDGPAALFFTDGHQIGASLDRNGLRPVRYALTKNHRLIMASETGALRIDESLIIKKGRLRPGEMILIDLLNKKIIFDDEVKATAYKQQPYREWVNSQRIKLKDLPIPKLKPKVIVRDRLMARQISSGITEEDIRQIILPTVTDGYEPVGSMGMDIPLAVLSTESQHIANYFKQYFAQVSNPPIDPIREKRVMTLFTRIGASQNILQESPEHARQVHLSQPILSREEFYRLKSLQHNGFSYHRIDATYSLSEDVSLKSSLESIANEAEKAVKKGNKLIIVSNRKENKERVPIPSLLALGAIHHHLVKKKLRTQTGLIVEASDAWEVHHFATLIGYGASGIYPYLVYDSIQNLLEEKRLPAEISFATYCENFINAIGKGLLKVMSKMGISTLQSYQSSQIFECLGLCQEVIDMCFKGTVSRLGGLSFDDLDTECKVKHRSAYLLQNEKELAIGGVYQWKRQGEKHLFNPKSIHLLQKSTKLNDYALFKEFTQYISSQGSVTNLRDLIEFKTRPSIRTEEVEPIENILRRFATGAMSFGSISHEAHSTLAIAMNRMGAKSNSGEGGEDPSRYVPKPNGDSERSAIKQVASGRFGVTIEYLNAADELQIKIAQGAKPGEGGQLPGHKVDEWIARVRHSTPGVGLISPPPHHDIYSIEDLKQLIFDLKNANNRARISVKLVSEAGVGTIAAGVAKAKADVILISGADGGTGASPLSSLRHAGLPWEMGLAEAHQTLVRNNLRNRVVLQTDGKLMTGRDLAIAILLGAEEFGISTTALIVEGCIMMRKCHLNTCPVGIATQNPELRELFTGKPEEIVSFFRMLAQDLREIMAQLGFRTIQEMVGQSHALKPKTDISFFKHSRIDLHPILHYTQAGDHVGRHKQIDQIHELDDILDQKIIRELRKQNFPEVVSYKIRNTDRAVGTYLSSYLTRNPFTSDRKIKIILTGSAGQSLGAFLSKHIEISVLGEANDYVGKGLSGGTISVQPAPTSILRAEENIIVGNVCLYGATSGDLFINGQAGERFAVRNSGAEAVVEGIGDHGCEYMTGGKVLIIGNIGKNFAAGMSGGIAYLLSSAIGDKDKINQEMVMLEPTDSEDLEWIKDKLSGHLMYTKSLQAKKLLSYWDTSKTLFTRIIPREYKAALSTKKKLEKTA